MDELDYDLMWLDIEDRVNEDVIINISDWLKDAMARVWNKNFKEIKDNIIFALWSAFDDRWILKFKITNDIIENLHQVFNSQEMDVLSKYITLCDSKTWETIKQQEWQLYILFKQPNIWIAFDDDYYIEDEFGNYK